MKKFILPLTFYIISICSNGQSINASQLLDLLTQKDIEYTSTLLKKAGFEFHGISKEYGTELHTYKFEGSYGIENFAFGKIGELFGISYQLEDKDFYNILKSKFLDPRMVFAYEAKGAKYYESADMRVGVNDTGHVLSLFIALE